MDENYRRNEAQKSRRVEKRVLMMERKEWIKGV